MRNEWRDIDDVVAGSFIELGNRIVEIAPDILGALLVLIIGLLVAGAIGQLVASLLRSTGVDSLLYKSPLGPRLNVFPRKRFVPSRLVGWLVKWFLILVTLIAATNILGWTQINEFLNQVVLYIPNVIIAVIILVIGFIASDFVRSLLEAGLETSPLAPQERRFLAGGADLAITLFAVMAALIQLKIAATLIQTLFTGLVFAISLAVGLSFGLGGREHAARILSKYSDRIEKGTPAGGGTSVPPMA